MKMPRTYLRIIRHIIGWSILCLIIYTGYQFYRFALHFESSSPYVSRPPSVEGFLPIGALMGFKYWILTGAFNPIHPAAIVIFIAIIVVSIFLKKGFCSHICPVGTISEAMWKIGKKVFGRNISFSKAIDYGLRSIKYLLMSFFLYVIIIRMDAHSLNAFLSGPYYKIADIKLLKFFTEMSTTTMITLSILTVLSIVNKNFWCRYLCPYGALLGLLSCLSPIKVTRDEQSCIHCGKCTENCPSYLVVEQKYRVISPECTGCLTCISHCPAKGALDMAMIGKRKIQPWLFTALCVSVFFGVITIGKVSGYWKSSVSYNEYKKLIPIASTLEHPR